MQVVASLLIENAGTISKRVKMIASVQSLIFYSFYKKIQIRLNQNYKNLPLRYHFHLASSFLARLLGVVCLCPHSQDTMHFLPVILVQTRHVGIEYLTAIQRKLRDKLAFQALDILDLRQL